MVSRLILNLKSAAQTTSVWASGGRVSGVSQSADDEAPYRHHHRQTYVVSDVPEDDISKEAEYVDSNEGSQEGGEGEFRVGVTMSTEGPSGEVELNDLWVTRQEIGRISSSSSSRRWSRVIKV
jgi:hypothetical protein